MPIRTSRFYAPRVDLAVGFVLCLFALLLATAPANANHQNADLQKVVQRNDQKNNQKQDRPSPANPGADYSGMYSFLRDGEFLQLTVEDGGRVIGFVSRYGNSESDHDVFLDHLFKSGKLEGNQLAFVTETVQGVSFEFQGTVERGEGKSRPDEAYYVLKGTLLENTTDEAKRTSSRSHEVALRSFPQDLAPPPAEKK